MRLEVETIRQDGPERTVAATDGVQGLQVCRVLAIENMDLARGQRSDRQPVASNRHGGWFDDARKLGADLSARFHGHHLFMIADQPQQVVDPVGGDRRGRLYVEGGIEFRVIQGRVVDAVVYRVGEIKPAAKFRHVVELGALAVERGHERTVGPGERRAVGSVDFHQREWALAPVGAQEINMAVGVDAQSAQRRLSVERPAGFAGAGVETAEVFAAFVPAAPSSSAPSAAKATNCV